MGNASDIFDFKINYEQFCTLVIAKQKEYHITGEINKLKLFDICAEIIWYNTTGDKNIVDIVELIILLKTALKNKSGIRVTNIKKILNKCDFEDSNSIFHIMRYLETKLFINRAAYYDDIYGWDVIQKFDYLPKMFEIDIVKSNWIAQDKWVDMMNDKESPYTLEQLYEILKNENELIQFETNARKKHRTEKIKNAITLLKKDGIFRDDLKTIATNEACFIFDIMNASNKDFDTTEMPLSNSEKYQYIKSMLKK